MREIVLDTETTGLDPFQGHRVVEIGCVELVNRFPTGRTFHCYINPERDMPTEAFGVHGLSAEFLRGHPVFQDHAEAFLDFVAQDPLVIHNGTFDLGFLNAELGRCERPVIARDRVLDTLLLARRKHPNGPNRLDDLCGRYGIDTSRRTKHGALLDAEILAEVYLELIGARQAQLGLGDSSREAIAIRVPAAPRQRPQALPGRLSADDIAAHGAFVATLGSAIWLNYATAAAPESTAA
jgi:DNA polymerase-3 subunit epsilon